MSKPLVTMTFSMVAEGHGLHLADLQGIQANMEALGCRCELIALSSGEHSLDPLPAAYVLVLRKGVDTLLSPVGLKQIDLFQEGHSDYINELKGRLEALMGLKAGGLKVKSNFDTTKYGIGDGERHEVIGVRYSSLPMYWQWYHNGEPLHEAIVVPMNPGDMYIMSEKAVGTDWKKKTIPTLRHATLKE
jgi:hypothetical protein